jgi:hypothetical protein
MEEAAVEEPDDLYLSDWSQLFVLTDIDHNTTFIAGFLGEERCPQLFIDARH